jgi:hypothetical protein
MYSIRISEDEVIEVDGDDLLQFMEIEEAAPNISSKRRRGVKGVMIPAMIRRFFADENDNPFILKESPLENSQMQEGLILHVIRQN